MGMVMLVMLMMNLGGSSLQSVVGVNFQFTSFRLQIHRCAPPGHLGEINNLHKNMFAEVFLVVLRKWVETVILSREAFEVFIFYRYENDPVAMVSNLGWRV